MKNLIIGTAGHVDHGKTALVRALTGQDTDRLKEEKERGISIELGFAPFVLKDGRKAAIVDVPGHERFVRQMLAGAVGMDIVLLIVAADEGIMPQTREHLDIVELLKIERGIVVITKKDLVEEDWLDLVQEEVREYLQGTSLAAAPMVAVSAITGEGIEELQGLIEEVLPKVRGKESMAKVRLPIDRVFTVAGFGTVVTGTLFSGVLRVGDTMELAPSRGLTGRVRNLQVHGETVEEAHAGQRVAVNLSGVEIGDVERGMVALSPDYLGAAYRLTFRLELLHGAPRDLKQGERVRFYLGTAETLGRISLLEGEEVKPGEQALAQIALEKPVIAARGDRFVIRSYSPALTIGGGTIIETDARKLKRSNPEVLIDLLKREKGDEGDWLLQVLKERKTMLSKKELLAVLHWEEGQLAVAVGNSEVGEVQGDGGPYYLSIYVEEDWANRLKSLLRETHDAFPLRVGLGREEIRSRLFSGVANKAYNSLLTKWKSEGWLQGDGQWIGLVEHQPHPPEGFEKSLEQIVQAFHKGGWQPPGWGEIKEELGKAPPGGWDEFSHFLLEQGILIKVDEGLYLHRESVQGAWQLLETHLQTHGELTVSEARDMLNSSRKYVLPLLEYFDREKKTRRMGEKRVLF